MTWKCDDEPAGFLARLRLTVRKAAHDGVRRRRGLFYGQTDDAVIETLLALDDLCCQLVKSKKSARRTNAALREFYSTRLIKTPPAPPY